MGPIINNSFLTVGRWALGAGMIKGVEGVTHNPKFGAMALPLHFCVLGAFIKPFCSPVNHAILSSGLTIIGGASFVVELAIRTRSKSETEALVVDKVFHAFNEMVSLAACVVIVVTAIFTIDYKTRVQCVLATSLFAFNYATKFYHETTYLHQDREKSLFGEKIPGFLVDETELLIGATTPKEGTHLLRNRAFLDRFQLIAVPSMTSEERIEILKAHIKKYQENGMTIPDDLAGIIVSLNRENSEGSLRKDINRLGIIVSRMKRKGISAEDAAREKGFMFTLSGSKVTSY